MPKSTSKRKPHSKSRKGCAPCKQRRVKCDEQGPPCVNCVVRKSVSLCVYIGRAAVASAPRLSPQAQTTPQALHQPVIAPAAPRTETSTSLSSAPRTTEPARPADPTEGATQPASTQVSGTHQLPSFKSLNLPSLDDDRNIELELMRQWCLKTHLSICRVESDVGIWLGAGTDLALRHRFLMDMILGLSSLQMAYEQGNTERAYTFVSRALQYQDAAMTKARASAAYPSGEDHVALYCFSVINLAFSMVSPQLASSAADVPESAIRTVLVSFQHVSMLDRLTTSGKEWIDKSPFNSRQPGNKQVAEWQKQTREKLADAMGRLQNLVEQEISASANDSDDRYKPHRDAVSWLFRALDEEIGFCVALLAWAGWPFVEDVKDDDPSALLILMHWATMLNHMKLMWWAQFISVRVVDEASRKLKGRRDGEWIVAAHWCRATVGLPLINMHAT
ncbi:Transcriptional activator protein UGA3 [Sphaceloma murrayae]|uniref:Transcriptional activator protein UGA3 n=1 Tax=Sphaceloma murrayae TaxID=2082308 RepID=A0A2K1QHR5_9PEZI|nr:Transcriptional activator protein UGA3 [Sphaceloma murrayae]